MFLQKLYYYAFCSSNTNFRAICGELVVAGLEAILFLRRAAHNYDDEWVRQEVANQEGNHRCFEKNEVIVVEHRNEDE